MAKMHLCSAIIDLGGDIRNTVWRGPHNPVSYPELEVLREVHSGGVHDIAVVGEVESDFVREKARLLSIYGAIAEQVYPGHSPAMPLRDPTYGGAKAKPIRKTAQHPPPVAEAVEDTAVI